MSQTHRSEFPVFCWHQCCEEEVRLRKREEKNHNKNCECKRSSCFWGCDFRQLLQMLVGWLGTVSCHAVIGKFSWESSLCCEALSNSNKNIKFALQHRNRTQINQMQSIILIFPLHVGTSIFSRVNYEPFAEIIRLNYSETVYDWLEWEIESLSERNFPPFEISAH